MRRLIFLFAILFASTAMAENVSWLRYPAISPDASTVAFSYKGNIYLVDANGGEARQLTSNSAYDYSPVWSPDGKTLAFASDRFGNFDIYTVSVTGGEPKDLLQIQQKRLHGPLLQMERIFFSRQQSRILLRVHYFLRAL